MGGHRRDLCPWGNPWASNRYQLTQCSLGNVEFHCSGDFAQASSDMGGPLARCVFFPPIFILLLRKNISFLCCVGIRGLGSYV